MAALTLSLVVLRDYLDSRPRWAIPRGLQMHWKEDPDVLKKLGVDRAWSTVLDDFFNSVPIRDGKPPIVVVQKPRRRRRGRPSSSTLAERNRHLFAVGDRVLVQWLDGEYVGKISQLHKKDKKYLIKYEDGDIRWTLENDIITNFD